MAHVGTLRDFRFENSSDDIRGATLYGRDDEKLGKIHDVIFDHSTGALRYLVVDTGGWLHSKQFLVPADRVRPRGDSDEFVLDLSKKQVENFPPYDESCLSDDKRWNEYECEYRGAAKFEETGGILHQEGSTNILVPEGLPAEGPAPTPRRKIPSGYRSPIRHHEVGLMDTTPTAIGSKPGDERLSFVPDALGVDRGDIKDKKLEPEIQLDTAEMKALSGKLANSAGMDTMSAPIQAAPSPRPHEVVHRSDDSFPHPDPSAPVEETIEGDALFNSEDVRGRLRQAGNIHDADEPSFETVPGSATEAAEGRLPNYPDASQGKRWARFEESLRAERPKIVGRCSVCEALQNRHKEDAA